MCRLTGLLVLLLFARTAAAQDAFEQQRAADLARMTGVDPILVRLTAGKTTYRIGERIPLRLEFQPIGQVGLVRYCGPGIGLDVVFDRPPGTYVPRSERDLSQGDELCGVIGGVWGGVVGGFDLGLSGWDRVQPVKPPPVHEDVDLNEATRVDVPGRYRFYVRTRFAVPQAYGTPPRLSNIITIDIVERDLEWESSLFARATRQLDSELPAARAEAFADLAMLGTEAAVDLLARRPEASIQGVAWSARNRAHLVDRMAGRLDDPSLPVEPFYVSTLAAVEAVRSAGAQPPDLATFERLQQTYSARRLRALAAAGQLDAHLAAAMRDAAGDGRSGTASRVIWKTLPAGFADVADAAERALLSLSPALQRHVLEERYGWREFADRRFLPMFRRLAAGLAPEGPQDLAWAMWHRLEPRSARAFARRDIVTSGSVLGASGLPGLSDRPLPELDDVLARQLEAARSGLALHRALSLIERYATARIGDRVARAFERAPAAAACPQGPIALAYFFRVDPAFAERQLDRVARAVDDRLPGPGCAGLWQAIGKRRWLPGVEAAAIRRLSNAQRLVDVDAADALKTYGGPTAKAALLAAFDAWHTAWNPRAGEFERRPWLEPRPWTEELRAAEWTERTLADALAQASGWRLTRSEVDRITTSFVTPDGREQWVRVHTAGTVEATITTRAPHLPGDLPSFFLSDSVNVEGSDALLAHVRLWPVGTSWQWEATAFEHSPRVHPTTLWLPGQEAELFSRVQSGLAGLGMTLRRR